MKIVYVLRTTAPEMLEFTPKLVLSNECLFLEVVGPKTHDGFENKLNTALTRGVVVLIHFALPLPVFEKNMTCFVAVSVMSFNM